MEAIKTSENVEFDVIYADGTRHHVSEGVLFEVKDEKLILHNGTDRPGVFPAVGVAAAQCVGAIGLPLELQIRFMNDVHKLVMGE